MRYQKVCNYSHADQSHLAAFAPCPRALLEIRRENDAEDKNARLECRAWQRQLQLFRSQIPREITATKKNHYAPLFGESSCSSFVSSSPTLRLAANSWSKKPSRSFCIRSMTISLALFVICKSRISFSKFLISRFSEGFGPVDSALYEPCGTFPNASEGAGSTGKKPSEAIKTA